MSITVGCGGKVNCWVSLSKYWQHFPSWRLVSDSGPITFTLGALGHAAFVLRTTALRSTCQTEARLHQPPSAGTYPFSQYIFRTFKFHFEIEPAPNQITANLQRGCVFMCEWLQRLWIPLTSPIVVWLLNNSLLNLKHSLFRSPLWSFELCNYFIHVPLLFHN